MIPNVGEIVIEPRGKDISIKVWTGFGAWILSREEAEALALAILQLTRPDVFEAEP